MKIQRLSRQAVWKERTIDEMRDNKLFACLHEAFLVMEREPMLFPMDEQEIMNEVGFEVTWLCALSRFGLDPDMEQFKRQVYANTGQHEHAMAVFSLVYAVVNMVTFPPLEVSKCTKNELRRLNKDSHWGKKIENFVRHIDSMGEFFNDRFECYKPVEYLEVEYKEEKKSEVFICAEDEQPLEEGTRAYERTFTLDEIVDYAKTNLSMDASLPIQNLLYALLCKDGTDEERRKVMSIPGDIIKRDKPEPTHKEIVLQKHVGTEIQNVEAGGTGVNNEIKDDQYGHR